MHVIENQTYHSLGFGTVPFRVSGFVDTVGDVPELNTPLPATFCGRWEDDETVAIELRVRESYQALVPRSVVKSELSDGLIERRGNIEDALVFFDSRPLLCGILVQVLIELPLKER